MNSYDGPDGIDPAGPYVAAFQAWEGQLSKRMIAERDLAMSYQHLIALYREKCAECDREKRNAMLWEKEQRMSEKELNGLKAAAESSPFAFVVIDGDGAVFREDLIAMGEEGGGIAAHELHQQLRARFQDDPVFSNLGIDTIFVNVVLSVDGLSRALHASAVLPVIDHTVLTKFGRGFCRAQPLFSFIDVGYGKEQADHKVRKLFEVMEKNIQCRALVLGGCHDNGYATFLESFRGNQKIWLLETTPRAADFRKLNFKCVSFPSVFRSEPVPSRPLAPLAFAPPPPSLSYVGPAGSPPPLLSPPSSSATPSTSDTGAANTPPQPTPPAPPVPVATNKPAQTSSSYATVGRSNAPVTINISSQKKPPAPRLYYQLNKNDERVDVPLPKSDPNAVKSLEDRRQLNGMNLCNRYHLLNNCKNPNCNFYHGERLNPAEMLALRHKTRNLVCGAGHRCRDVACNLGHHCSNPGSCYFGDDCRFSDTHGMDITPTIKVYDDGTREVI